MKKYRIVNRNKNTIDNALNDLKTNNTKSFDNINDLFKELDNDISNNEINIDKLFKGYKKKPFKSDLFEFKPTGREKW
ncbi:hypothetical protein ABQD64_13710 [Vagococcus fluvialis]|uniref:hypothetical protein n=1 Tax=Vagococcus fluvialis TaxID=2738 RepID=UPI0032E3E8C3